jgi:uncharacterized protein involved in exopolysaccharide biosynthesis
MLPPARQGQAPARPQGVPLDVWRFVRMLRRYRVVLISVALASAVLGVVIGKWVVVKTYAAPAVLLWEPPSSARADAQREISTLVDSVKLPTNLGVVRDKLGYAGTLEQLAKQIEVSSGDNSMLITITGRESSRQGSADLTNAMVDVFLESQKQLSATRLQEVATALRASLAQSQQALDESRRRYDQFRTDNRIGDLSIEMQAAIEEVARLRVAANDARVELQTSEAEEEVLRKQRTGLAPTVSGTNAEQQRAEAARLGQVEADLASARAKYTDEHPRVKILQNEASRLKTELQDPNRAVPQVTQRNPAHATVGGRMMVSSAAKRSAEQRRKALGDVIDEAERHAAKLTAVQGQAANLLADMTVAQDHVAGVLKQLATAEDDVRSASSYFQIVSRATVPEYPEKGIGRTVALATPLGALLLALLVLLRREMSSLVIRTGPEAAYWSRAPVLWSTSWPGGNVDEMRELGREMANILETRPAVVGISVLGRKEHADTGALLASISHARLVSRGEDCAVTDLRNRATPARAGDLADALEHRGLGEELAQLRAGTGTVLAVLPTLQDIAAVRASLRWLDALVVVVPSGKVRFTQLQSLRAALSLPEHGLGIVVVDVPQDLLGATSRTAAGEYGFWPSARRRRRSSMMAARLSQGTGANPMVTLPGVPPR